MRTDLRAMMLPELTFHTWRAETSKSLIRIAALSVAGESDQRLKELTARWIDSLDSSLLLVSVRFHSDSASSELSGSPQACLRVAMTTPT